MDKVGGKDVLQPLKTCHHPISTQFHISFPEFKFFATFSGLREKNNLADLLLLQRKLRLHTIWATGRVDLDS